MKLLLTGSNGFIGNYFVNKYAANYKIARFSFLNDDFKSIHVEDVDVVIHLAALVHQMGGATKEEYEKVNVTQTLELAKKAKEGGVKHFIFMSTVKVYGEETDIAYTENSICSPEDEYGKSKLKAEQELQKLEDDGFKVSIIRTPIVYGYGVKANIKNLVSLVQKVSVLPFGGIDNKRSMVYIGNLCHLIDAVVRFQIKFGMTDVSGMASMNGMASVDGMTGSGVFLASDDEAISTTKLIELIAKELDKKVYLIKIPFFETLLKLVKPSFHKRLYGSLVVDNRLTKDILEFKNLYTVEDGIRFMTNGEVT
ncbi:NAD-dependent epimerase/dehydratase family protein [Candidatus Sulfurimonas marisnigri]|uniref:NAD-dependent epimerase/dehydratase family protein n=1 Tax=Candidatus Sulfurimonas marisnigri TaxID=2740405 RepID=A0A7S7RQ08_9BACT|nr:NAD-dependent epimerase/dehydratase family protein [Candidatus Sulfurimonas marisnigri]QOY54058.1 NAD-dependent epimerase/dehydratase family protein [Candidatus Sulfurimonas marisnigri]